MAKGTNVANAIVTVIPSMEGARTKISKELPSMLSSASAEGGKSGGKQFGSGFTDGLSTMKVAIGNMVGNVLSSAVQSASGVIKDTLKDAFTGFADYEQLKGGVEKIFDEADQAKIFEDANNAYKDLNMSANDYLSAVNEVGATFAQTMGDQKGYDTARRGMKAISDFASGTGRDLDELNEKYKLITRSAGGYQSIADQFAGILPQTSADFLKAAKQAGLLSDEYTKLTDVPVDEYQQAVTAMLEKGVEDLGLMGNTFNESEKTISGSLAAMESSWDNFISGLANPDADISQLTHNLIESIGHVIENAGPVIAQMLAGAFEASLSILDEMGMTGASDFLRGLRDGLTSPAVQSALESVMNLLQTVGDGLSRLFGPVDGTQAANGVEMIAGAVQWLADLLRDTWPLVESAIGFVEDIGGTVVTDLIDIFKELGEALGIIGDAAGNNLGDTFDSITSDSVKTGLKDILGFLKDGILTAIQWLKDNGPAIGEAIGNAIQVLGDAFEFVVGVVQTVATVIWDLINQLVDFFTNDPLGQQIVATVVDIATTIGDVIGVIFEGITFIADAISKWLGETDENGVSTFEHIAEVVGDVLDNIAQAIYGVAQFVDGVLTFIKGLFELIFGMIKAIVNGDISELLKAFDDMGGGIEKIIGGVCDFFEAMFGDAFDAVGKFFYDTFGGIMDFIADIPKKIADMFAQIKLPELKIEGDWNLDPFNFQVPEIKFMKEGGFLNRETVIAGEAGTELYWPEYDPYFDKYASGIAKHLDGKTGGDTYIIVDGAVVNSTEEMKKNWYDNFMELKRLGVMSSGYAR
jgi:phage-related protein